MARVEGTSGVRTRGLTDARLRDLFREMLVIRRFEEAVEDRFRAGELPGFLHVAIGEEAVASGVCAALEADDVIASTHRAHNHAIAKGTSINALMAELYGKVEGCSGGYGGSMHLYDVSVGNLGANAVVVKAVEPGTTVVGIPARPIGPQEVGEDQKIFPAYGTLPGAAVDPVARSLDRLQDELQRLTAKVAELEMREPRRAPVEENDDVEPRTASKR